jgi:hypothetical protein
LARIENLSFKQVRRDDLGAALDRENSARFAVGYEDSCGGKHMIFLKILAAWTVVSIFVGVGIGPLIRWGLHYKPPEPLPLHPMPPGSIDHEVRP